MAECTCADPQAVASAIKDTLTSQIKDSGEALNKTLYGESQAGDPGEPGNIARIRFCHWAAPEYGQVGESAWINWFKAAELGIALLNSIVQGQIADKQQDLAEGYYQQAKSKWDRFAGNYMPLEKKILWETSSEPVKSMDCEDDRARAQSAVSSAFNYMDTYIGRVARAYRLCLDGSAVSQLAYSRNLLSVDTENYNLRDDQWFVDFKNDQRWNRRSNILNLGRNLGSTAMQYGDVARKLLDDVSRIADKAAGSISQALGYYGSRFDTYYPTTYLGGKEQPLVSVSSTPSGAAYAPSGSTFGASGG